MKKLSILISGLCGSILTLIVQTFINAKTNSINHKRSKQKILFLRKLEIVEKAMAWYQEAIDTFRMLQMAFKAYTMESNDLSMQRIQMYSMKSLKLFEESSSRLNPIYLYYDFSSIENKYNAKECNEQINKICTKIADINIKMNDANVSDIILKVLNEQQIDNFNILVDLMDRQICMIAEIQSILRKEYLSI